MKNLSSEFKAVLDSQNDGTGITQRDWAERAGVDQSTVTRLVQGARPGPKLLKALCDKWRTPGIGKRLIAAYLRDEIDRAGINPDEIQITV